MSVDIFYADPCVHVCSVCHQEFLTVNLDHPVGCPEKCINCASEEATLVSHLRNINSYV